MKNYKIYEIIWHRTKDDGEHIPDDPTYHSSYVIALTYKNQREDNNKKKKNGDNVYCYYGSTPQPKFVTEEEYKSLINE